MKDSQGVPLLASPDIFLEIAGCYIMRNRPDTTLTDQSDEICLRPSFPCILQPHSSLLVAWNAFVAFLILVICIVHPYNLIFKKVVSQEFRFFDFAMTIVYVLDHIVYLSTGANVEEGVPITFAQTSSKQMRSHWFVLNVVATLPIFEFVGDGHFAGINKLLSVPKLFRELKSLEESCGYRSNVLRFLSYTLLLLIACYFIAAIQQGFMCFQAGYCLVTNFTHSPFWEESPLDDGTIAHRLIFGLYWAISMISFINHRQTWAATEWKHVIYTLFILEICIVLRIFMEAVYSATIMVTTAPREDYGARIETVKNFLVRNEVDPELRKRFITYLELCWYTDKAYTMTHKKRSNIFHDLPPHVFQDIVGKHRINYIHVIPFMKLVNKEDLKVVMASVKIFYTSPNEILINTGELTNEIYIIKRGICEKCIGQLTAKTHFGSLTCLLRLPAYYTIRAVTHVHVMCIPRKVLGKVLSTPQISQALKYLKTTPEFQSLQTPIPSFVTYVPPPPTANLMYFRLPRKHQLDTEFLAPFDRLGFLSILRYIFPRYTIRPDGNYLVRYEWFRFFCAFLSVQLFPAYTYLVLQWPYLYYVAWFLDLAAYYDIFQRMLIGYFNDIGILVYHPASTASYYMKGAFIVDLFGCLPLENLESPRREGQVSCDSNEAVSDAEPHPSVVSHARSHEGTQGVHWTPRHSYDMYILGGEATIKMKRHLHSGPPPRTKTSVMKYIYFQEGAVLFFLVFICMGCIYLDLYNAGFEDNSTWLLITLYSLDVCFYLKIFTQHAFPFLVPSKSLKKIMLPIRRQYFRREFKYDLISVLPIELFTFAGGRFAILRLNRMFRIVTVYKCLCHRKESITVNLTLTTVMAVSIWFTLIVHTSTCIWYFMAVVEDEIEPGTSWMHLDDGTTHCDNHYICSLYFVLTTFTQNGVGDIMPKKHSEILSTMVFMIYVGELSNIIQYQSYRSFSFYSKYLELQKFLKNNRVSQNLVTIVNKYTLHLWREKRGLQIPHFLKEAPLSLRLRIMSAAYLHHITRHHIFEECEPAFLRQMVGCLKLYTYNEGMYVVKESEITDAMYVIHTGKVRETSEEDTDVGARVYPAGSYFGVGLLRNTPYTHSYQTVTKSQVLTLKLDDWEYLLNHFPESKKSIHKHMSQLGDDNTDHSNWPGGPITEAAPDYVISEMQQDTSDMPQFPDGRRHFGRDSTTDVREEAPPKDLTPRRRKESRYFAFPSDNKKPDTISVVEDGEEENRTLVSGPSGIQIQDTRPTLKSILGKIAGTAKKLMGRVSDPELTAAGDELLLEEDAEATEALLKHFDKAKKQEKSTFKRQRTRRPSLFYHAPEETTEKHLVTLDMESDAKLEERKSDNLPVKPLTIRKSSDVLRLSYGKSKVDETASKIELTIDIEGALDENKARENKILSPSQGPAPSQGIKETSRIQATQNTPYTSQATTSKQATRDIMTPTGQILKDSPSARKLSVPTTLSYPEQKTDQKSTLPDLEKVIDSLVIQDKTKSIEPTAETLPPTLPKAPLREAREKQIPGTSKPKDIILKSDTSSTPPFVAPKVPSKSDESRLEPSIKLSTPPAQDDTNIQKREENANIPSVIESTELISEALVDQDDTKKQSPSEAISTKPYIPQKLRTESNKDIQSRTDTKEIKLRYSAVSSASSIILRPVASTETEPKEANQVSRSFHPARSTSTMHTLATTATETSASRPYTPIELSPNINRDVQHSGQESQPNKDITNIPATASKPAKTETLREYKADEDVASQSSSLSEEKALETVDLTKPSTVTVYEPAPTPASSTALGSKTKESSAATAERKAFKKKPFIYDPNPNYDEDDGEGEIIQDPTTTAPPQPTPTLTQEEGTNTKSSRRSIRVRYDEHKDDDMEYGSDTDESEDEKPSKEDEKPLKEDETRTGDSKQPKRDDKGATSTSKSGKPDKKSKK
ncbi:hypothetical protein SFRURICE_012584 [Spodoptera frugiperda]|nr:hypothetical protein SFRURICE_012584 [Spodoptera frugiperda]